MENISLKNFEVKKEYKIFGISSFMANTTTNIFKVVEIKDNKTIVVFKNLKGNYGRKKFYLNVKNDNIIIPLNECILKADSETNKFSGNARFNFLNTEQDIREQLKLNMVLSFKTKYGFNMVDSDYNYIELTELNQEVY